MFKHVVIAVLLSVALYATNYERGDDAYGDGDIKKAVSFWETGAKNGELGSQFMLGLLYLRGDDVEINTKKAASLLAKIFNSNDETLQITVALAYYKNRGHKPEDVLSLKQFEEAIDKEGEIAQYNLGILFVTEAGVEKDLKKGATLIKKAKESNLQQAKDAWKKYDLSRI